jgi:plasmid stabilization system protein ParE
MRIITFCEKIATFPLQGRPRDDIRPGLRVVGFRRRAVIAFTDTGQAVMIVGIFYGSRDYEAVLAEPED